MPMLEVKSCAYQDRIEAAILEAVFRASMTEDGRTAVMLSGEIVKACLNTIALMAGTSEVTATRRDARLFAEECAKSIRSRSAAVREKRAASGIGFLNVVQAGERH